MTATDPCVETTWYSNSYGYGIRKEAGRVIYAHREAWEAAYGPIPPDMCVCHHCDNRRCVNVAHLFVATSEDNSRDRHAKGRDARGEGHGCAKLVTAQVHAIRADPRPQRVIAADYGVSHTQVGYIKRRVKWAHA